MRDFREDLRCCFFTDASKSSHIFSTHLPNETICCRSVNSVKCQICFFFFWGGGLRSGLQGVCEVRPQESLQHKQSLCVAEAPQTTNCDQQTQAHSVCANINILVCTRALYSVCLKPQQRTVKHVCAWC